MPHFWAYVSARFCVRLATATSSTISEACAAGITFRLMSAVDTIPHVTGGPFAIRLLSRNGGDRRRHARVRLHGQGALERLPQDRVHDVAAAARAEARRHGRAK